jgi:hypothetical protein
MTSARLAGPEASDGRGVRAKSLTRRITPGRGAAW